MSETRLYVVERDGDVVPYEQFKNAHGGCMAIWRTLAEKYLGASGMDFTMMLFGGGGIGPLVKAAQAGKLEPWEVVTLMTTYDRVVIPVEHVASVASALEEFAKVYGPLHEERNHYFTIAEQAEALRTVVTGIEEHGYRGVCWNQMSVSESLWDGVQEEGEDDRRPYNVDKDQGHWFWPETKADAKDAEATRPSE